MKLGDGGNDGSQTATDGAGDSRTGGAAPTHSTSGQAALLTAEQAAALLGVSVRSFHELRREAWMTQPVVLGPRLLRWPRAELEAAIARMPRQTTPGAEPAQLRRRRIESLKTRGVPA